MVLCARVVGTWSMVGWYSVHVWLILCACVVGWYSVHVWLVLCAHVVGTLCMCSWYSVYMWLVFGVHVVGTLCMCGWYSVHVWLVLCACVVGTLCTCGLHSVHVWFVLGVHVWLVLCGCVVGTMCTCGWYSVHMCEQRTDNMQCKGLLWKHDNQLNWYLCDKPRHIRAKLSWLWLYLQPDHGSWSGTSCYRSMEWKALVIFLLLLVSYLLFSFKECPNRVLLGRGDKLVRMILVFISLSDTWDLLRRNVVSPDISGQ